MNDYLSLVNSNSISSKLLPLVSGSLLFMNKNPATHIKLYTQNVPEAPNASFKIGNVKVKIKDATQSENVAIDMATPRILLGNISDKTTHVIGASDME